MKGDDTIKELIEEVKTLEHHPRNLKNRQLWTSTNSEKTPKGRRIPVSSKETDVIPYTIELDLDMWSRILGFNPKEFYTDARSYLINSMRIALYRFNEFKDCTPIDSTVRLSFGVVFESGLFGADTVFSETQSPWISRNHLINDYSDIKRLSTPDFYHSGLMPLAHKMYHELIELTLGQFAIVFPHWFRGPFGVATHLRGTNEMLMDLYLNPGFVHELMNLITETRKQWYGERARFLGSQVEEGVLANDEVNSPSLSASLYDDFVLPYEKSLCDYHNGIAYWHSCGNINSLLESIARIKRINILHIGPWTDMKKAKDIFRDDSSYEICLMPTRDVYSRDREDMKSQIQRIKKTMKYSTFSIRADSFQVVGNIGANINAIKEWSSIARNELLNEV